MTRAERSRHVDEILRAHGIEPRRRRARTREARAAEVGDGQTILRRNLGHVLRVR